MRSSGTPRLAGVLLTGGASRRMGFSKALMCVNGVPSAVRLAGLLRELADPVLEVGPGTSGLPSVLESPPGSGPLVALAAASWALRGAGFDGDVLVLACDLPLVGASELSLLARWPMTGSIVPVVAGHPQPLCSRWTSGDLVGAEALAAAGERSMRALVCRARPTLVECSGWVGGDRCALADIDTPEELEAFRSLVGGPVLGPP